MASELDRAESYMTGWRAGYNNAIHAERQRILKLLKEIEEAKPGAAWSPKYIIETIEKESGKNEA